MTKSKNLGNLINQYLNKYPQYRTRIIEYYAWYINSLDKGDINAEQILINNLKSIDDKSNRNYG